MVKQLCIDENDGRSFVSIITREWFNTDEIVKYLKKRIPYVEFGYISQDEITIRLPQGGFGFSLNVLKKDLGIEDIGIFILEKSVQNLWTKYACVENSKHNHVNWLLNLNKE